MKIEEVKRDMDIVTFVEEYLGIKLLPYQKECLKRLSNQDTRITCPPETGYSLTREIMKRCLQKN